MGSYSRCSAWRRGSGGGAGILCLAVTLAGCTGAALIDNDVSAYRGSFAYASDEQVLRNIVRARDNLPIHFSELQNINTTVQMSASANASFPFGQNNNSTSRYMISPSISVANNPQFSLGTLETQEFTKGIMSPVDPTLIKQFLDQGVDPRIIFILFFAEIETATGARYLNSFACQDFSDHRCYERFFNYLTEINKLPVRNLYPNVYVVLRPVGPPVPATDAGKVQLLPKDLAGIDGAKFSLKMLNTGPDAGKYQLYSVSPPQLVLCTDRGGARVLAFSGTRSSACASREIIGYAGDQPRSQNRHIRSVYQMIQHLGQILNLQDADAADNRCIVLERERDRRSCDTGDVLFQVNSSRGQPVISASLGGRTYSVVEGGCSRTAACDHSTQVLGILTVLLNINKVAKDIPNPAVVSVIQ